MGRKALKKQLKSVLETDEAAGPSKASKNIARRLKKKEEKKAKAMAQQNALQTQRESLRYYRKTAKASDLHRKLVHKARL